MSRPIKFRAWDKKRGWIPNPDYMLDLDNGLLCQDRQNFYGGKYILSQYTGIKDINGVEVYEGDILVNNDINPDDQQPRAVAWESGGFWLDTDPLWDHETESGSGMLEDWMVIGNIYENKDML